MVKLLYKPLTGIMFHKILLLIDVFAFGVKSETHVCTSTVLDERHQGKSTYRVEYKCCLNYHLVNDICQECPPGTYGSGGMCDKPCPENSYGKFCSLICQCEENERCDAVNGCICNSNSSCTNSHISTEENMNTYAIDFSNYTAASKGNGRHICLEISIILCIVILSFTMLTITTSSYMIKWYLG
ncbi:Hypothetical predicted protein [Mytilus galloprovincialis]|uniref:Tyrosine-protein kinase ephrin type A/B receptor-like domain-containing protein n=1 Tax=Mytilus galloprovincialis TaxID=29158 RepID=A0A8B6F050_MYTGA|nr:Hypothetical predicted protein [Mytilus galloprovincialis]